MYETYDLCVAELYGNIDEKYKAFNDPIAKSEYKTLGVRIPVIKKLAKSVPLNRRAEILTDFFAEKEHTFESVLFAGCLAARKGDYEQTREYLMRLIPLFGSWAHVDCVVPCLDWADSDALWKDFRYLTYRNGQYEKRMHNYDGSVFERSLYRSDFGYAGSHGVRTILRGYGGGLAACGMSYQVLRQNSAAVYVADFPEVRT